MRVWITGIAGFLASHLSRQLLKEGHVIDGNDSMICGDKANVPPRVGFWKTDCRNNEILALNMLKFRPDVVIHTAATAHEGLSNFSPSFITENIYGASVSVFSAAISSGAKRIVYLSSMSRYGNNSAPFKEYYAVDPVDPYGIAKVAAEDTLINLCKTHGVKWSIAVPHNIIGIRQRSVDPYRNVAAIMINRCKQGKAPIVYGDGSHKRCFSPVDDCIPSLIKMVTGAADGEVVNIGPDNTEITIKQLAETICNLTGRNEIQYMPARPNEVANAYTSSEKARKLLGYHQRQSLMDCLKEMVDYIKPEPFIYDFPIEIERGCPETWLKRIM